MKRKENHSMNALEDTCVRTENVKVRKEKYGPSMTWKNLSSVSYGLPLTCTIESFICKLKTSFDSYESSICKLRTSFDLYESSICKLRTSLDYENIFHLSFLNYKSSTCKVQTSLVISNHPFVKYDKFCRR